MTRLDLTQYVPKEIVSDNGSTHTLNISLEGDIIPGRVNKIVPKDNIALWYITETPSKGKVHFSIMIPRFIELNREFGESLGLYLSDGSNTFCNQTIFQNNEPNTINLLMRCLKRFGIQYENWRWCINFNARLKEYESPQESRMRERAAINFWLRLTPINLNSAFPTMIRYSNKNYEGQTLRSKPWGSLTISYGNTIFKNLWLNICNRLLEEVIANANKELATHILRGWVAGDGYSRFKIYKNGLFRQVGITAKKSNQKPIMELLKLLGVSFHKNGSNIYFHGFKNLMRAYKNELLSLNLQKQLNLIRGLIASQVFPSFNLKKEFETYKLKLKEEIKQIETELKRRNLLFTKLKQHPLQSKDKRFQPLSWSNFIKGLIVSLNITPSKLAKSINSGITTLEKWLSGENNPSFKYQVKLHSFAKENNLDFKDVENLGNIINKIEWKYLMNGILIENEFTRKELAKVIRVHPNTIESIINRRDPSFVTLSKIFKLISYKDVENLTKLAKSIERINWKEVVKEVLNKRKLTQQQLAKMLKCSRSLVREWKAGNAKPTTKHQKKLLELVNPLPDFSDQLSLHN